MIYGIEAAAHSRASSSSGAVGTFDFVGNSYSWNGSSLTAAELIDHPEWIGAGGLQVPDEATTGAVVLGDPATFLKTCQWTAFAEVEILGDSNPSTIIAVYNNDQNEWVNLWYWDTWTFEDRRYSPSVVGRWGRDFTEGNGVYRMAGTRVDGRISFSLNGNAVSSNAFGSSPSPIVLPNTPMTSVKFGGWASYDIGVNIHKIMLYDPLDDSSLPNLSSL